MTHRGSILKQSLNVAFATFLSRILGLFRVMFESMVLGGGTVASAWQLAFMIPNLFRRILGEGALGTALIPVLAHTEEREGLEKVRADLTVVFAALGILLAAIVIVCSLGAILLVPHVEADYWKLALKILPLLMPYALLICFSGVVGAVLNSRKEFFLPALGAVLLNVFLIAGLAAGFFSCDIDEPEEFLWFLDMLAYLVLASGVIQLGLLLLLLKVHGVFPRFSRAPFRDCGVLRELWRLVLPGMIGAAALQLSFLADRTLASWLGPHAVPALTYTDRLVDLPIGLLAVALGSVLMANMARSAAKGDLAGMRDDLEFGLRLIWFCCVPMAVFLVLFRLPLLRLLLFRGNFTLLDLSEAAQATFFLAMGLPFFCSLKVILPAFYSRKQVTEPLVVSIVCILVNIILNLILMWPLKQGGIALATVLSSVLNNSLLLLLLFREGVRLPAARLAGCFFRTCLASALAGVLALGCLHFLTGGAVVGTVRLLAAVAVATAVFGAVYLAAYRLCGGQETGEFFRLLRRRNGGKDKANE